MSRGPFRNYFHFLRHFPPLLGGKYEGETEIGKIISKERDGSIMLMECA